MGKRDITSLGFSELSEEITSMGEKAFRGKQVYEWVHKKLAVSFAEMSNLPKEFRERLAAEYEVAPLELAERRTSPSDGTSKFLFRLQDGQAIESVWMKYKHGNSVCISSQAGCRMGCRFCASALGGLVRNLSAGEMLSQVYEIQRITGERVSNVVVMGTGEPLDNYGNLLKFISMLTDDKGLHISQRNVTISTCGLAEKIKELAGEQLQITLAISLHAPNDAVRKELMPIANLYKISDVLEACRFYYEKTGRRISFEYSLVQGVNDSGEQAEELAARLKALSRQGVSCHVNLIPVNPIKERNYAHSEEEAIQKFKFRLEKNHINVTIRREMGSDIDAACGQLRKGYMDTTKDNKRGGGEV